MSGWQSRRVSSARHVENPRGKGQEIAHGEIILGRLGSGPEKMAYEGNVWAFLNGKPTATTLNCNIVCHIQCAL
jgi:hypothetical protein